MADISTFSPDGGDTIYNLKDATARTNIATSFSASETEIKDTVGWVGKNLLKNISGYQSVPSIPITSTTNSDGSITFDSSNTALTGNWGVIVGYPDLEVGKTYIISCKNATNVAYLIPAISTGGAYTNVDASIVRGEEKLFTVPSGVTSVKINIQLLKNNVYDNLTLYPMIRDASIIDDTYEPYHKSVEEEITQVYADNGVLGAKNLIPYPYTSTPATISDITFTDDGKGRITAQGIANADATYFIRTRATSTDLIGKLSKNKTYKISGGVNANCFVEIDFFNDTTYISSVVANGTVNQFTVPSNANYMSTFIFISNGTDLTTPVTFEPMIWLASDPDSTYQPYAMTNRELTEMMVFPSASIIKNGITITTFRIGRFVFFTFDAGSVTTSVNEYTKFVQLSDFNIYSASDVFVLMGISYYINSNNEAFRFYTQVNTGEIRTLKTIPAGEPLRFTIMSLLK